MTMTRPSVFQVRLMRRLSLMILGAFLLTAMVVALSLFNFFRVDLADDASQSVELLQTFASQEIGQVVDDVVRVSNSSSLRDYARLIATAPDADVVTNDPSGTQRDVLRDFNDLLEQGSESFTTIRYISLDGQAWAQAKRQGTEVIITPVGQKLIGVPGLNAALNRGIAYEPFFATVGLAQGSNAPALYVYVPIASEGNTANLIGTTQLTVQLGILRSFFGGLLDEPLLQVDGRRILLVDSGNRVLADSAQTASNSAIIDLLSEDRGEFTAQRADNLLVSARYLSSFDGQDTPWRVVIVDDRLATLGTTFGLIGQIVLVVAALVALVILLANMMTRRMFRPLMAVSLAAQRMMGDDVPKEAMDEIGILTATVDNVSKRIDTLTSDLEQQVKRRSRDLEVAVRIGREIATLYDIDTLLNHAVNLIAEELGFYHAQVFLVDDAGINAVLLYSRGKAGQRLIEQGFKIPVGSNTVIGTATATAKPVIVNDTGRRGVTHAFNPLLPDTRAELGMPLIIRDRVIGVLDIQSKTPDAFLPEDLPTYTLLADQLALAIENARLVSQTDKRIQQIDTLNRQLTRVAWEEASDNARLNRSYEYNLLDVKEADAAQPGADLTKLTSPIVIRGEVIGEIAAKPSEGVEFTDGDSIIIQAVANRVALAVENARLFQQTQNSLTETSTLYQLSRYLNEANTLEDILQAIIVSVMPEASGGQVWMFDEYERGEEPEWLTLRADLVHTIEREEANRNLNQLRLRVQDHPFLDNLERYQITLVDNTRSDPRLDSGLKLIFRRLSSESLVLIPLMVRGQWRGVISVGFPTTRDFTERESRVYSALSDQAGVAIDNRLLLQQTEEEVARNENLYAASRIINTAESMQDLVYAAVATSTDPDLIFSLSLLEGTPDPTGWPTQARTVARSRGGAAVEVDELYDFEFDPDSPMRHREPEIVLDDIPSNMNVSSRVRWVRSQGFRFMATFPLFSANQPIALFHIGATNLRELSASDYEAYRALTGQMSSQIQIRKLLERTESALDETRRLYVASRALTSATEFTDIYQTAIEHLVRPFSQGSDHVVEISLLRAEPYPTIHTERLDVVYRWRSDAGAMPGLSETLFTRDYPYPAMLMDDREGVVSMSDVTRSDAHPILLESPRFRERLLDRGVSSLAVAAMSRGDDRWFGVILCQSNQPRAFDESYVRFLSALADQVAIAIDNRRLFQQTQEEQRNLRSVLETMPAGVLVLDAETLRPVQFNQQAVDMLGEDVIDPLAPFSIEKYNLYRSGTQMNFPESELPIYVALEQGELATADDIATLRPDGIAVDLLVNAAPIRDDDGKITSIVVAFQDITSLRSLEYTLQQNLRETVSLYEAQRQLSQARGLEEVLDVVMMHLIMQQPADSYIVTADRAGRLRVARSMTMPPDDAELLRPLLELEQSFILNEIESAHIDKALKAALLRVGANAVITLPMSVSTQEMPAGWIVLLSYADMITPDQERVLSQLRDVSATALDNRYLIESQAATLREVRSLYNAINAIARSRDIDSLTYVLREAVLTMKPDYVLAYLDPASGYEKHDVVLFDEWRDELEPIDFRDILRGYDIPPGGVYLNDLTRIIEHVESEERLLDAGVKSLAAIHLQPKDVPGGMIVVAYTEPHGFTDTEDRYLNTLADSASVVFNTFILFNQIQNTLEETSTLYQASRALSTVVNTEEILGVVVNYLIAPHINQVFIAMLETPTWKSVDSSVRVVNSWSDGTAVDLRGIALTPTQFPAWRQLAIDSVLTIDDIETDKILTESEREGIRSLGVRSVIVVPLRVPKHDIGAVWLGSSEIHYHTDRELRTYQAFAEQASLSLEAAYLLQQTERRARQLETSAEVSQSAAQLLDLDELFPRTVNLIQEAFGYDHVQIFLMDEEQHYAELRASTGSAGQKLLSIKHKLAKGSDSVIGMVTARGKPQIALDTAEANVIHRPNPYLPATRSEMALPLIIKGGVVGALDVQSNQPNAFNEEDIRALTTLAAQISVAIDNANLYVESQAQTERMKFLFDVTFAAAAAETMEETLQTVAEQLRGAFDALAVVIYLPQLYTDDRLKEERTFTLLRPVAIVGSDQPLSELEEVRLDAPDKLIASVGRNRHPMIVESLAAESGYIPVVASARSGLILPLLSGANLLGLIVMEDARTNAYGFETLQVLLTLSGSLSAVIQSTQLLDQLQRTNEQLRELDRLKSDFLANMSHELRTPLNSIIGFSRVMLKGIDGPLTEMQEQDLSTIYNSGQHLLMLINDVLDQAKIAAEKLDLKFAYFEVKPLIEGVRSIGIGLVKDKPIDLRTDLAPNLPQVYGDEFRTRQILLNLVSNASKFTREGQIILHAYPVQSADGLTYVRIDVEDTGIGIAEKDIPLLFEAFRQVDSSLTRTAGGTGLGLPIAKSLTEMQGGEMLVQSRVNVGSVFSITVPTQPVAHSIEEQDSEEELDEIDPVTSIPDGDLSSSTDKPETAPIRKASTIEAFMPEGTRRVQQPKREVLLIEDNKDLVDQFRRTLQREGFEVQTADHPAYAEAMVSNMRPTVIVMDVNFSGGEGWNILQRLKDRDDTFDIPIIVVTLSDDSGRVYQLGAHSYIQRPFMPEQLVEAALQAEKESNIERILIIDDEPDAVRLLTQLLNENGTYRVFSAPSGLEGISLVARRRPDLIILDLRMPEMDGFAVLRELRNNPETSSIPVLIVTGEIDLKSDELAQLNSVRVLHKTDISEEEFQAFIEDIKKHLEE